MYRQVAKLMNYEEENFVGIKILETGLEKNGDSANIWFDLQLQSRYSKSVKPDDWIRRNYSSILQKYKPYPKNVAAILIHRSKWLFYKEIFPNRFKNVSILDECFADIILAKSKDCQISVVDNYISKLNTILKKRRNQRPEYLAWFQYNFFQNSSINEIIELYRAALRDNTCSGERKLFVIKNLSIVYLHDRQFSEAISILRDVTQSNKDCRVIFAKVVIENPSRSLEELLECLELGNFDVITLILDILEAKKKRTNLKDVLLSPNFFNGSAETLFFSKFNYKICAKILLLFENDNSFFISEHQTKSEELIRHISDKVNIHLEIPIERPTLFTCAWRRARLELEKSYNRLQTYTFNESNPDPREVDDLARSMNGNTLKVLSESRIALDPCIAKYFKLSSGSLYPHAFREMTDKEKKEKKQSGISYEVYPVERMKFWLSSVCDDPSNVGSPSSNASSSSTNQSSALLPGTAKLEERVIEEFTRTGFEKKGKVSEDILKFAARREYHIIKKEAAWHSLWVETDNFFKHKDHARDVEELERKLNEYREITKLFLGKKITAYDVAHQAAEFAEQTFALFLGN